MFRVLDVLSSLFLFLVDRDELPAVPCLIWILLALRDALSWLVLSLSVMASVFPGLVPRELMAVKKRE